VFGLIDQKKRSNLVTRIREREEMIYCLGKKNNNNKQQKE